LIKIRQSKKLGRGIGRRGSFELKTNRARAGQSKKKKRES